MSYQFIQNEAFKSIDNRIKPAILDIANKLILKGWEPIVIEGRRTIEQQQEKVRKGYSKTMKSYHLTGLAVDIVDRKMMWNSGTINKFGWDMANIALEHTEGPGIIRLGLIWGDGGEIDTQLEKYRYNRYKELLDKGIKNTSEWFIDFAHLEFHL